MLKYKIERTPLDVSELNNIRSKGTLRQSLEILDNAPTVYIVWGHSLSSIRSNRINQLRRAKGVRCGVYAVAVAPPQVQ